MSLGRYRRLIGRRPAQEADAELAFHLDMRTEDYVARGLPADEARRRALARIGDYAAVRDDCIGINRRLQRRETMAALWETLVQDIRLAARMLARQKLWTALAVITLGIGIGANTALFSIVNAVLLRPLPYPEPDRIMSLTVAIGGTDTRGVGEPDYLAWKERSTAFSSLAAFRPARTIIREGGEPQTILGRSVMHDYFSVFGTRPILGRTFLPEEDVPGAPVVVILGEQLWRRVYNGDSSILGRGIKLDETLATVIGVMPASFGIHGSEEFWRAYRMRPPTPDVTFYTNVVGRLADGVSVERARAELQTLMPKPTTTTTTTVAGFSPVVMSLHERRFGDTRPALLMLVAAVVVLLLIACANVANLLLARAIRRQREFAVRATIGASAWRLVRFTLCESLLLSLMGAAVGLVVAAATLGTFVRLSPPSVASADGIAVDGAVMGFTALLALGTGVVFGLIPALQVRRTDLTTVLAAAGTRAAGGRRQAWMRRALVIGELATALMLVTGAGLLLKSFATVTSTETGLEPGRIVVMIVDLPRRYTGPAVNAYFDQLKRGISGLEGVEAVALADAPPLFGARMSRLVNLPGRSDLPRIDVSGVEPQYFRLTRMRLAAGRAFDSGDVANSQGVAILNETAARVYGNGPDVVGQRLLLNGAKAPPVTVVGVVRDIMQRGVEEAIVPMMYQPLTASDVSNYMTVVARTRGDPRAVLPMIRDVARRLDPQMPVPEVKTLEERLAAVAAPRKFSLILVGSFAAIGALLAIIGLYGVMSYLVAERTSEIGVRVALGADEWRIGRFVIGEGMTMALIGVVVGLVASVFAVQLLRTMLFKVSIHDPMIFVSAALLLMVTAFVACALPARRAARLDPVEALRRG